jgi:hypothetical protein
MKIMMTRDHRRWVLTLWFSTLAAWGRELISGWARLLVEVRADVVVGAVVTVGTVVVAVEAGG